MRTFKILSLALVAGASLAGCTSMGPFNGHSSDAMQMVVAWKNPDYGPMTTEDWATVERQANFCKKEVADKQLTSAEESEAVGAVAMGLSGGLGLAGGADAGNVGTWAQMGPYGAVAGAANGVVTGALVHSSTNASVVGYCANSNLSDRKTRRPGVHAMGAYVRTTNHTGKVPSWVVPANSVSTPAPAYMDDEEDYDSANPPLPPLSH